MPVDTLVIVPSRSRPHNVERLIKTWRDTTDGTSELLICLDDDDAHNYTIPGDVSVLVRPRMRLGDWWNYAAANHNSVNDIRFIGFLGDDNIFGTTHWEKQITEPLRQEIGVSYGNDQYHGPNLPTAAFLSVEIIDILGYACPPKQTHLFLDNFWQAIGVGINSISFVDVNIEHLHHTSGKAPMDTIYQDVNSEEMWAHDRLAWEEYCKNDLADDIKKIKDWREVHNR